MNCNKENFVALFESLFIEEGSPRIVLQFMKILGLLDQPCNRKIRHELSGELRNIVKLGTSWGKSLNQDFKFHVFLNNSVPVFDLFLKKHIDIPGIEFLRPRDYKHMENSLFYCNEFFTRSVHKSIKVVLNRLTSGFFSVFKEFVLKISKYDSKNFF